MEDLLAIEEGQKERDRTIWEAARFISYNVILPNTNPKKKKIKLRDIAEFPWDEEEQKKKKLKDDKERIEELRKWGEGLKKAIQEGRIKTIDKKL